jgi:hypothetical protein
MPVEGFGLNFPTAEPTEPTEFKAQQPHLDSDLEMTHG